MAIDLTGEIQSAIDGSLLRGAPVVIAYVTAEGKPALSYRGSAQVHGPEQLAVWARKDDEGLANEIAERPDVSLLFFQGDGPGPRYLSITGRAKVDPSASDDVYAKMVAPEQERDPEKAGVAVVIDVDSVFGFGAEGQFQQTRE